MEKAFSEAVINSRILTKPTPCPGQCSCTNRLHITSGEQPWRALQGNMSGSPTLMVIGQQHSPQVIDWLTLDTHSLMYPVRFTSHQQLICDQLVDPQFENHCPHQICASHFGKEKGEDPVPLHLLPVPFSDQILPHSYFSHCPLPAPVYLHADCGRGPQTPLLFMAVVPEWVLASCHHIPICNRGTTVVKPS